MAENQAPEVAPQPAYQALVDEFMELDRQCQEIIDKFISGAIIRDCIPNEGAASYEELFTKMQQKFQAIQEYAKDLIEKRNAKIQQVGETMRPVVFAGENMIRGADGKPSFAACGPFAVASRTHRSLSWEELDERLQKMGLGQRIRDLTYTDPQSGKTEKAVKTETTVAYEPVKNWLRENNLEQVLQEVYEEEESTPALVESPKPLAWIGGTEPKKSGGRKGKGKK